MLLLVRISLGMVLSSVASNPARVSQCKTESHFAGSNCIIGILDSVSKLVSSCPHLQVNMGGIEVSCLLDTGFMVSTVTESFFNQHFALWGQEKLQTWYWLQLRAANELAISYISTSDISPAHSFDGHFLIVM